MDYVIWFLVRLVNAAFSIESDIHIIYYFHIAVYNWIESIP